MRFPVLRGVIDRRILVNFRVEAAVMAKLLPAPFRPKLVQGMGVAGICLIRLKGIRPWLIPGVCGCSSENAAHRMSVEWDDNGTRREGVYIPRRDTSSRLNACAGGRIFPGDHHLARFQVQETAGHYRIRLDSRDDATHVAIEGDEAAELPAGSIFSSLDQASRFFEEASLGYSPCRKSGCYAGIDLRTSRWAMRPLAVDRVASSFFEDQRLFPKGSTVFDSALLMRDIPHEWHSAGVLGA
jgi:Uncharacterized conserved protein (COG2071)